MSPAPRLRNVLGLLAAFVVTAMTGGVLAAGLAMPAVGASGVLTKNSVAFFDGLPGDLAQPALSEQSRLLAADGTLITTFYEEQRVNVPLERISPFMQAAVVAIEDARFFQHGGVDPKGLARAAIVNQISGGVEQGASTLTQQYVKNVLVETAYAAGDEEGIAKAREKSAARKLKEIRMAVTLEQTMQKKEILNRYLNIAWFGGKINGVESASKYYFNTRAEKLTLPQAATLAGMIQNPPAYDPADNPKDSLKRRNVVLARMLELKNIDQATHDAAVATALKPRITPSANGCANAGRNGYFCEYVRRQIIGNKAFSALGKTPEERENTLKRGGLVIRTTMDPKVMKSAWKALDGTIPAKDKSGVATASVSVEPGTGRVLSIQQNRIYDPSSKERRGREAVNFSVDNDWGGGNGFQTGSTIKPFTLATWLKKGKSLNATVPAGSGVAPFSAFKSCNPEFNKGDSYTYFNAGDGIGKGNMSVWKGTAQSVNGVYVSMEKQLDLCDIRETAEELGLHLAKSRPDTCTRKLTDRTTRLPNCFPSLTLGPADISPMTMAAAYAGFAAEGKFCQPIVVDSIKRRDGTKLKAPSANCKQTMEKKIANTVTLGLSKVLTPEGTGARLGPMPNGRPASGKTGTTNDSVDTWFAGYTPQLATAVWVGDPDPHKVGTTSKGEPMYARTTLNRRTIDGQRMGNVYGATLAGPIWKKIMVEAMKGKKIERFAPADAKLLERPSVTVPSVNGRSVDEARAALEAAGFTVAIDNDPESSSYPPGRVASTSPGGGSRADAGSEVTIRLSAGGGGGDGENGDDGDDGGNGNDASPAAG